MAAAAVQQTAAGRRAVQAADRLLGRPPALSALLRSTMEIFYSALYQTNWSVLAGRQSCAATARQAAAAAGSANWGKVVTVRTRAPVAQTVK